MLSEIKTLIKQHQEQLAVQESTNVLENEINEISNSNKDFLESVLILNEETESEKEKDKEKESENDKKKEPELASEEESYQEEKGDFGDDEIEEADLPEFPETEEEADNTEEDLMDIEVSSEDDSSENNEEDNPSKEPESNNEEEPDNSNDNSETSDLDDEPVANPDDEPINDTENDTTENDDYEDLDNQVIPDEDDELPDVIGRDTDEPIQNADTVILSTEIDISTGTPRDTLPIPPMGAADTVASDDQMSQHLDTGFGDEPIEDDNKDDEFHDPEPDDIIGSPVVDYGANANEDDENESDKNKPSSEDDEEMELESMNIDNISDDLLFMEEINVGGNTSANNDQQQQNQQQSEQPADANVTPDDTTGTGGQSAETQPSENSPVTDEILNQVNDGNDDSTIDIGEPGSDDDMNTDMPIDDPVATEPDVNVTPTETPAGADNTDQANKIFSKLTAISKDVEDAKAQVVQILSKK